MQSDVSASQFWEMRYQDGRHRTRWDLGAPTPAVVRRLESGDARAFALDRFSHAGKFHQLSDATPCPRPLQRPYPPLWIAASTNQLTFELAGRYGLNLITDPYTRTPDEVRRGLVVVPGGAPQRGSWALAAQDPRPLPPLRGPDRGGSKRDTLR